MLADHVLLMLLALASLAAAGYAQMRLSQLTASLDRTPMTCSVLLVIGIAVGYLSARLFGDPLRFMLAFVLGLGVVHLPAACILLLKAKRGEGRS